jgi:hypothetical protein
MYSITSLSRIFACDSKIKDGKFEISATHDWQMEDVERVLKLPTSIAAEDSAGALKDFFTSSLWKALAEAWSAARSASRIPDTSSGMDSRRSVYRGIFGCERGGIRSPAGRETGSAAGHTIGGDIEPRTAGIGRRLDGREARGLRTAGQRIDGDSGGHGHCQQHRAVNSESFS